METIQHNIKKIVMTEPHKLKNSETFAVSVVIVGDRETHKLTLFSKDKETLKFKFPKINKTIIRLEDL